MARGKGVGGDADLDGDEGGKEGRGDGERDDGLGLGPALVAAVVEAEEEAQHGRDEEEGAEEVDAGELLPPVGVVPLREVEHAVDCDEGDHDHGHLPEERPMVAVLAISSTKISCPASSSSFPLHLYPLRIQQRMDALTIATPTNPQAVRPGARPWQSPRRI